MVHIPTGIVIRFGTWPQSYGSCGPEGTKPLRSTVAHGEEEALPGDSYVVPFWVYYRPEQVRKQVITKKELHRSLQVACSYRTIGDCTLNVDSRKRSTNLHNKQAPVLFNELSLSLHIYTHIPMYTVCT